MRIFLAFFILITCFGCNKNKQQGLVYFNDFENIKGWTDVLLDRKPVHSGSYSNRLDSINTYGETFKLSFKEISDHIIRKVKVKLWVFFPNKEAKGKFVIEINQPDKKNLFWIAKNIEELVKTPGEWTQIEMEFSFVNKDYMLPQNVIKIFPWNLNKQPFFVDDVRLEFII